MAHIKKFKASATGGMICHYERSREGTLERENIDRDRTHLNYCIGYTEKGVGQVPPLANAETVSKRVRAVETASGKKVRKDAVVMADMVVTKPQNVPDEDAYKFFAYSYMYLGQKVGRENMMGGYVHMDEKTPHIHMPFTPVLDGKFNYKKLCDRTFYQQFHKGLGDFLEEKMGYRPQIELDKDDPMKLCATNKQADFIAMKEQVNAAIEQQAAAEQAASLAREDEKETAARLESLRQRVDSIERFQAASVPELAALAAGKGLGERERAAQAEKEQLAGEVAELEQRIPAVERAVAGLRERVQQLGERLQTLVGRVGALLSKFGEVDGENWGLSARTRQLAKETGVRDVNMNSLAYMKEQLAAAARWRNEQTRSIENTEVKRKNWTQGR